jgi:hypothetical protein
MGKNHSDHTQPPSNLVQVLQQVCVLLLEQPDALGVPGRVDRLVGVEAADVDLAGPSGGLVELSVERQSGFGWLAWLFSWLLAGRSRPAG